MKRKEHNMCKTRKTNDEYEKAFMSFEELYESSVETHENSVWERVPIKEMKLGLLPNLPLCIQDLRDELSINPDTEDDTIVDTMEKTGLVLIVNGQSEVVRDTALRGIQSRARLYGSALARLEKQMFAYFLNTCFSVWGDNALVLTRHGKVTAVHSGDDKDYSPLPVPELLSCLKKHLDRKYPGWAYKEGIENHELTTAYIELPNQKDLLHEYEKAIVAHGGIVSANLIPGIVFVTSDTGKSGANVHAMLCDRRFKNRNIRIGTAIKLEHRSQADISNFDENLGMLYAKFVDQAKALSELLDIPVYNPVAAMKRIAKKLSLPAKQSAEAIQMYVDTAEYGEANAHELYMALYETAFLCKVDGSMSQIKQQEVEESLARALTLDWTAYDYPEVTVEKAAA